MSFASRSATAVRCAAGTRSKASGRIWAVCSEGLVCLLPVDAVLAEKPRVEVGRDLPEQRVVFRGRCLVAKRARDIGGDARHARVERRRHERVDRRHVLRRQPVTEAGRQRVGVLVAVPARPLRHPHVEVLLHERERPLERAQIAVAPVALPRQHEPERVPRRRGAAAVRRLEGGLADVAVVAVAGAEQRHLALCRLRVGHVLEHLSIEPLGVDQQRRRARGQLRVARPAVLLVDRRVGDDPVHVALDRPRRVAMNARQRRLADLELRRRGHARVHDVHADHGRLHAVGQRLVTRRAELHVLKALVSEAWPPGLRHAAARHVVVGLQLPVHEGVAVGRRRPVAGELLRVEDLDRRAGRRLHFHLDPAGQVLPDVVHDDARHGRRARAWRASADDANRLVGLGSKHAGRSCDDARRRPRGVVEAGPVPSRHPAPGVVGLAEVVAVVARRTVGADLPRSIRRDDLLRAIEIGDAEIEPQPRRRAPLRLLPAPVPRARRVVEVTRPELGGDDVLALSHGIGHVVGGVEHRLRVVGERRLQLAIGDPAAVDGERRVRETGGVEPRAGHLFRDAERVAQHRRRPELPALALVVLLRRGRPAARQPSHRTAELPRRANLRIVGSAFGVAERAAPLGPGDPLAVPVGRSEQSRLEPRGLGPVACQIASRPHAHAPEVPRGRLESWPAVDDPRIRGRDASRVPHVGLALACQLRFRRDEHARAGLHYVPAIAGEDPAESRRRVVDAERRRGGVGFEALDAKARHRRRLLRRRLLGGEADDRRQQKRNDDEGAAGPGREQHGRVEARRLTANPQQCYCVS